jgi:glyceraldehyde-3-phosphate dehydrogenase (NADP+)
MKIARHKLWIDGQWVETPTLRDITASYDRRKVAEVCQADNSHLERALVATHEAFGIYRHSSSYLRSRLLHGMVQGIIERKSDLAEAIIHEAGKPKMLADAEVARAIMTFTIAAEECKRFGGERIPVDLDAGARAYSAASTSWFPRGPVLAVAPFNFPLNLIAHKVAPALASGCSVVIKPPPQAPGAAAILAQIFEKAAREVSDSRETVPPALLQVINGSNDVIGKAVTDPRIATLSFTGSDKVGWMLQGKAIRKKVSLELGGNAAVIVHSDADVERAAARCAYGAFAYAGQICISVQRIFVHSAIVNQFQEALLAETAKIKVGDPTAPDTLVGPMIDQANAERVMAWIDEAKQMGARVLCGDSQKGAVVMPTIVAGVQPEAKISCEEVFGPVVTLDRYNHIGNAIAAINHSRFGLQAGIFTQDLRIARQVSEEVEAGGILINEVPTFRADNMPYGGVKDSGLGREGVRYAMEEMSERKVVVEWKG